jgi:enoyl-CoA hydratase
MADRTIRLDVKDHIAHVVLDRGKALNTMVLEFWQDMVDVFKELDEIPEARVVVLSSTGKHFTAGLDLNAFAAFAGDMMQGDPGRVREQLRRTVLEMQETFNVIDKCRLPVLAAIHGGCIGGGVDLISACDMRYCTEDAWFCIQEINIGMTADVGTLQRLPHIIPAGMMRELAYTGRRLKADRAREIGLVNAVYADHQAMLDDVMAIAAEIASKSPLAVVGTKEMLNYTRDHTVQDGLDYIAAWQSGMFLSADLMETMQAKAQKREPTFADLLPARKIVRK